jgi:cysteine desulfurase family protein (TIGR01976 family)
MVTPVRQRYDVERVRGHFPALAEGAAHFDGAGGSQVPQSVADAVAGTLLAAVANRGLVTGAERRADDIVRAARLAMADLVGGDPRGVVFGRSMTALTYEIARALAKTWRAGDEVVVTGLDHDANVRPWVQAAAAAGATVRWAEPDPITAELPLAAVAAVLSERTRLVAVSGASNLLGTRPAVPDIAAAVHAVGALLYLDGVHLTPHAGVDVGELGTDFYVCSAYKFLGPHLGALVAAADLLERLQPDKLLPMPDEVPERFEQGTLPYELLAGTTAAVDFLAHLVPGHGPRRGRVLASMAALEAHEWTVFEPLLDGLRALPGVTVYGAPARRTPTVLFTVAGRSPADVSVTLARRGVNAPAGSFYAVEPARRLGLGAAGGVRASLAPYTDSGDVQRLLDAVAAAGAS